MYYKDYKGRMFSTWKEGLLHLAIVVAFPIFPIIIYMLTDRNHDSYLYVLILTVVVSLLYEFMKSPGAQYSLSLTIETIICCVSLSVMLLWSVFSLLYTYENTTDVIQDATNVFQNVTNAVQNTPNTVQTLSVGDWVLVSLFIFPIGVVIFEIGKCIVLDIKASKCVISENNLVKGASTV